MEQINMKYCQMPGPFSFPKRKRFYGYGWTCLFILGRASMAQFLWQLKCSESVVNISHLNHCKNSIIAHFLAAQSTSCLLHAHIPKSEMSFQPLGHIPFHWWKIRKIQVPWKARAPGHPQPTCTPVCISWLSFLSVCAFVCYCWHHILFPLSESFFTFWIAHGAHVPCSRDRRSDL